MVDGARRRGMANMARGAIVLGFAAGLAAQAPAPVRAPHVGRVHGADGKPIAAAAVTFVAGRELGGTGTSDVVRAVSDANGRFRLELLPTRGYSAWAELAGAGGTRVGALVPRGAAATEIVIDAASAEVPSRLALQGAEAWQEHGPLRVELVVAGCAEIVPPATLGDDATMPLPPLPDVIAEVAVFARDRLVYTTVTGLRGPLTLPQPRRIQALVQDEQGKPVAGASVQRCVSWWSHGGGPLPRVPRSERHGLAVSDEQGKVELLVAFENDPFEGAGWPPIAFVASKPGCGESVSGFTGVPFCNGQRQDAKKPGGVLTFTLAAHAAREAKVEANAGRGPRELCLMGLQSMPYDGNATTSAHDFVRVSVGADGAFAAPEPAKDWDLQAVLVPEQVPPLADDDPFRRAATPHTLVLPASALRNAGGLDLRRLVPLRLQVLDATSGPAMDAAVLCSPKDTDRFVDAAQAMRARTDAAGRVALPLMPGTWMLVVVQGPTWAKSILEVGTALDVQTLQLVPLDRMPVRIVDGDGKPQAGGDRKSVV